MPAKKTTRFMTSSNHMVAQLSRKCPGDHDHQHLIGGRCAAAAFYPLPLVRAILRGIRNTAVAEGKQAQEEEEYMHMIQALASENGSFPLEPKLPEVLMPKEEVKRSTIKKASGGYLSISYDNWKPFYSDEYTGELLPSKLIHAAMIDELDYFNKHVWQVEHIDKAMSYPDHIIVRSRWVMANKGDADEPDVRARLGGCEVNKNGKKNDAFYASTPPLEAKKMLFSEFASERKRKGKPLRLSFVDVRKAYFNGRPTRNIFMRFPKELGIAPNLVGKLIRCAYGCKDAGHIWEECYRAALLSMGFVAGKESPCCFYHKARDVSVVVYGDDFTALGTDDDLDYYEKALATHFELKIRGRIGKGCPGPNEIKILNRCLKLTSTGLVYEADPRHTDLLSAAFKLNKANCVGTPRVKQKDLENHAAKGPDTDSYILCPAESDKAIDGERPVQNVHKINSLKTSTVKFKMDSVEQFDVVPYSNHYLLHPSKIIVCKTGIHAMKPHMDRYTGKSAEVMKSRRMQIMRNVNGKLAYNRRAMVLEQLHAHGKCWLHECDQISSVTKFLMTNSPISQRAGSVFLMSSVHLGCKDGISDSTHQTALSNDLV